MVLCSGGRFLGSWYYGDFVLFVNDTMMVGDWLIMVIWWEVWQYHYDGKLVASEAMVVGLMVMVLFGRGGGKHRFLWLVH